MKVGFMTLQAKERLILFQQIVGDCSVGIVAGHTVFRHRGVFEHKRAPLVGVTGQAQIVHTLIGLHVVDQGTMMLMATAAFHFPFLYRVMGGIMGFGLDVFVAIHTERLLVLFGFVGGVDGVAGGAGYFIERVIAEIPIDALHGVMALQTGLGRLVGPNTLETKNRSCVSFFDMLLSRPMTRLTLITHHNGFSFKGT
jgi:hypothetical protein